MITTRRRFLAAVAPDCSHSRIQRQLHISACPKRRKEERRRFASLPTTLTKGCAESKSPRTAESHDHGAAADHTQKQSGIDNDESREPIAAELFDKILRGVVTTTQLPLRTVQPVLQLISERWASSHSLEGWHSLISRGFLPSDDGLRQVAFLALAIAFLVHQSQFARQTSSAGLDFVWTLIRDALQSQVMQLGRLSVNRSAQGFLAVPLCSILSDGDIDILFRMHVWLPDGKRGEPGFGVHSHQPFAQSWVLVGQGRDYAYEVKAAPDQNSATHASYALAWTSGAGLDATYKTHQTFSRVVNTGHYVSVGPGRTVVNRRGMSYTIPAAAFHSSEVEPDGLHATLFLFDSSRGFVRDAPVLGPKEATYYTQTRDAADISFTALAALVDIARQGEDYMARAKKYLQKAQWQQAFGEMRKAQTLCELDPGLAKMANCQKSILSELQSLMRTHTLCDSVEMTGWRCLYGRTLLLDGQYSKALEQFDHSSNVTPAIAFCREPSELGREYLRHLAKSGADFERVDEHGCSALDYAVMNSDSEAEEIVLGALRDRMRCRADSDLHQRVREARVRKHFREIFRMIMRPFLIGNSSRALVDARCAYTQALLEDPAKARAFDPLQYVRFSDLANSGRFPRSSDGLTQVYHPGQDAETLLLFFSYRWLNPDPWATTPDDAENSQYRRTLQAVEEFLQLHQSVSRDNLGIWVDFACIDQDFPSSGIAALPMILAQCDAIISIVDDKYYGRAWCSVEMMMIQALQRSYGLHLWYECVEPGSHRGEATMGTALRKGPVDTEIILSQKLLRYEQDRPKILFLERQSKLLT
jgi:hypothetical protein